MPSKAKYNTRQKEIMGERDGWCCVLCGYNTTLHFHHVYFGQESMRTPERNDPKYGITCCAGCHSQCHASPSGKGKRQKAIEYIEGL